MFGKVSFANTKENTKIAIYQMTDPGGVLTNGKHSEMTTSFEFVIVTGRLTTCWCWRPFAITFKTIAINGLSVCGTKKCKPR